MRMIHTCERCRQSVPRSEAVMRGDGRRVKSWHAACYLIATAGVAAYVVETAGVWA